MIIIAMLENQPNHRPLHGCNETPVWIRNFTGFEILFVIFLSKSYRALEIINISS